MLQCNISHDIAFAEFLKVNKMEIQSLGKKQSPFYHLIIETSHKY